MKMSRQHQKLILTILSRACSALLTAVILLTLSSLVAQQVMAASLPNGNVYFAYPDKDVNLLQLDEEISTALHLGGRVGLSTQPDPNNQTKQIIVFQNVTSNIQVTPEMSAIIETTIANHKAVLDPVHHADIAENYPKDESDLTAGDIVSFDLPNHNSGLVKSPAAYDKNIIGVISTSPSQIMGESSSKTAPLALVGRVPVKISGENGPIAVGDPITSSSIPGVGMKAVKAGMIVGRALEDWSPDSGKTQILVAMNTSEYDPDMYLTTINDLKISSRSGEFIATNTATGTLVDRIGAYASIVSANMEAGSIQTQQLTATDAAVKNLTADTFRTSRIAPLPEGTDITLQVGSSTQSGTLAVQNPSGETVASIDSRGNASFSGEIQGSTVSAQNATISGTLFANQITALAQSVAGAVESGSVNTQSLIANTITVGGQTLRDYILSVVASTQNGQSKTISPTNEIQTNTISPIASDSAGIAVNLGPSQTFGVYTQEGTPAATFDTSGNATLSGQLQTQALNVTTDATIAGTLYADRIMTHYGEFTGTESATFITNVTQVSNATPSSDFLNQASQSAFLALGANLADESHVELTKDVTFMNSFAVVGDTLLGNTTVMGGLSVGGSVQLSNRGIESFGDTLYIQKSRLAALDIMNGAIVVNTSGDVVINGNVQVNGVLGVNTIAPIDTGNLTLDLSQSASGSSKFGDILVKGSNGNIVATIDASGSAHFAGNIEASGAGTFKQLIFTPSTAGLSDSVGRATIPTGYSNIMILNNLVTTKSYIFVTPQTLTSEALSVTSQLPPTASASGSFTVEVSSPPVHDLDFNWFIVN